jgi:hypothetical protein
MIWEQVVNVSALSVEKKLPINEVFRVRRSIALDAVQKCFEKAPIIMNCWRRKGVRNKHNRP